MIREWIPGNVVKRNKVFDPEPEDVGNRFVVISGPNSVSLVWLSNFRQFFINPEEDAIMFDETGLSLISEG